MTRESFGHMKRVIFLPVKTPREKLFKVVNLAKTHFTKSKSLYIYTEEKGALFIDELLWRLPTQGFLPHRVEKKTDHQEREEKICISSSLNEEIKYESLLNLSKEPILDERISYLTLYELDDFTSQEKAALSKKRYALYKQKGYQIISPVENKN